MPRFHHATLYKGYFLVRLSRKLFASKYKIKLQKPSNYHAEFSWESYLKDNNYNAANINAFVSLNKSTSEIKNKLEQLRALDNNMKINVAFAKFAPIGVDTKEDLDAIKKIMENKS